MRKNNTTITETLYRAAGRKNFVYAWGEGRNLYIRLGNHKKMNLWNVVMLHEVAGVQALPNEIYRIVMKENALNTAAALNVRLTA